MITKVRLKNWRSHLDSELDFSQGTNALLGSMGSGKTSVLDSICFGLFGTFPTLQTKKLKLDDIIMKKPSEKSRAEVEVQFNIDGKNYSVKRVIDKGKGTNYSELREDGKLLEAPNSQRVTELLEKILKVNYELFSKAIYSEQNALDYFLTIPKGQRMRKIDELLMIDRFEKARSNSVTLVNKLADRKIGKQSIIDQVDLDNLEKALSYLRDTINKTLSESNQLSKNLEEVSDERTTLERDVGKLKETKEILEMLKRDENGLTKSIEEISNSIKSLGELLKGKSKSDIESALDDLKKNIEEFENKSEKLRGEYDSIISLISNSKVRIDILKKEKIEKLRREIEEKTKIKERIEVLNKIIGGDVSKKMEERKSLYEKFLGEIQELNTKIENLDDVIQKLFSVEGRCPICDSILDEKRKKNLVDQKHKQIQDLKERLTEASRSKAIAGKELETLEDSAKKLDQMIFEIGDFDAMKDDLENSNKMVIELDGQASDYEYELSKIKKEIETLESKLKESTSKKEQFEIFSSKWQDYGERSRRVEQLMRERKSIEEKIADAEEKISGKDLDKMEARVKEVIAKESEIEAKVSGLQQLMDEKNSRLREYESKFDELTKQKEEVQKLDKLIMDLKIFGKALEQTQIELRTEFVEAVNYTMNKIWPNLYPYKDFVGVNLSIEEGDYVLQLKDNVNKMINADGVASGGERSIACLALRIAFSLVLAPQLRWLVLDEPTHNLDSKAVEDLAETLRTRISEFVDQIFLITHEERLEDAVTGSLYRLERDKGKDDVTKVVAIN